MNTYDVALGGVTSRVPPAHTARPGFGNGASRPVPTCEHVPDNTNAEPRARFRVPPWWSEGDSNP